MHIISTFLPSFTSLVSSSSTANVAAPKHFVNISGKVLQNCVPKDLILLKFCHNIHISGENCNFKILTKMKTLESTPVVYVIISSKFLAAGK